MHYHLSIMVAFEGENPFECEGTVNYASLLPIPGIINKLHRFESLDLVNLDQWGDDCPS